jgi:Uma2 family endonuclease
MARATAETTAAPGQRLRMTYDEWLAWYGEGTRGEWVGGEVIVLAMPKVVHQTDLLFLARLLDHHVRRTGVGELFIGPVEMRLVDQRASRVPDIEVILNRNRARITPDRLEGPADLVVELISDDTVDRDRREKRVEYAAAGIPEYWLFDPRPRQHRATFLILDAGKSYQEAPLDEQGRFHSTVLPGFWLDPAWLWQEPLPNVETLLAEIAGRR